MDQKLLLYSSFAASFLALKKDMAAQIIYHDIEPDSVIETHDYAELDIDDNGTTDFLFLNSSFTFYDDYDGYITRQDILAGPAIPSNMLAGISYSYYLVGTRYFPFAMENGDEIGSALTWQTWGIQLMGIRDIMYSGELTVPCVFCNWYAFDIPETINHYLGIRFIDSDDSSHYGWIRCDVLEEGRKLIIKDYAFELQTDEPIRAGDTASQIPGGSNELPATIFCINNIVIIDLNIASNTDIETSIFNSTGAKVYHMILSEIHTEIPLKVAAGLYIVEVREGKNKITKTIYLN